ncbi:DUF2786 domain-containing protein [Nocardioides sp. W3-2-3]|nr:DUF2786 domain-containing protein [Nocardioides convexus]
MDTGVDGEDRTLLRIGRLLRQAERTSNTAERDAFFAKAQDLATRHQIALAVARASAHSEEHRQDPAWETVLIGESGKRSLARYVRLLPGDRPGQRRAGRDLHQQHPGHPLRLPHRHRRGEGALRLAGHPDGRRRRRPPALGGAQGRHPAGLGRPAAPLGAPAGARLDGAGGVLRGLGRPRRGAARPLPRRGAGSGDRG